MFPASFENLPNLHINRHLVDHARNYGTCVNTAVGTKEMVHRIFKAIVPHTNKRNLELVLLQQINTLQTLRYLASGGLEDNLGRQNAIFKVMIDPKLKILLSGWCIDIDERENLGDDLDDDVDDDDNYNMDDDVENIGNENDFFW